MGKVPLLSLHCNDRVNIFGNLKPTYDFIAYLVLYYIIIKTKRVLTRHKMMTYEYGTYINI